MKLCSKCNIEKQESSFPRNKSNKDGLNSYCKECKNQLSKQLRARPEYKEYKRKHSRQWSKTLKGMELTKRRNKTRANRSYLFISRIKSKFGCSICGLKGPPEIFDFDHIDPTNKKFEMSKMSSRSIDLIKKEMRKCNILCSNCHRTKTKQDRAKGIVSNNRIIKKVTTEDINFIELGLIPCL